MLEAGLDPSDPAARLRYGGVVLDTFPVGNDRLRPPIQR